MNFITDREWWKAMADRVVKSFFQGYFTLWFLQEGLGDTSATVPNSDAFDTLFTMDNVKAGVVMVALSFGLNIISTPLGVDKTGPSATVVEGNFKQAA